MKESEKKMFEDVFIYSFAEPGAMGAAGTMELFTTDGKEFMMNYLSEETPYEEIKENFSGLADVYFNGPAPKEETYAEEIVLYQDNDKRNFRRTHVTPGWKHIYMGFGNHLVIRDDYYEKVAELISDLEEEIDIYCNWQKRVRMLWAE